MFIDPSFQGVNRLFVLSFENWNVLQNYKWYFLSPVELKDSNVKIDGRNFFDQTVKNNLTTYNNKVIGQGDNYITGSLLDDPCFKKYYRLKFSNVLSCNNKQD